MLVRVGSLITRMTREFLIDQLFEKGQQGNWVDYAPGHAFADTGLSVPAAPGEGIAGYLDRSPNGNDGTQAVITARPILGRVPVGGRRNLLERTEDIQNSYWIKVRGSATTSSLFTEDSTASNSHYMRRQATLDAPSTVFQDVEVKAATRSWFFLGRNAGGGNTGAYFNAETGEFGTVYGDVEDYDAWQVDDGYWNVRLKYGPATTQHNFDICLASGNEGRIYTGDGVSGGHVRRMQLAVSEGPYQKVVSQYDITEAGVPDVWYARYDGADDNLPDNQPIPAVENGCFVVIGRKGIWIDNEWVNTSGLLSVGPTTYTGGPAGILPVVGDVLSIIWRDEPLTEAEKAGLVSYGIKRGSAGLFELGAELVVNGDFSDGATGWSVGTSTVVDEALVIPGLFNNNVVQGFTLAAGQTVIARLEVKAKTSTTQTARLRIGTGDYLPAFVPNVGRYAWAAISGTDNTGFRMANGSGDPAFTLDNVSVRPLTLVTP